VSEKIVRFARQRDRELHRELLDPRRRDREHLEIDAHRGHSFEPFVADIEKATIAGRLVAPVDDGFIAAELEQGLSNRRRPGMLLDRYDAFHPACLLHHCLPFKPGRSASHSCSSAPKNACMAAQDWASAHALYP